jgi:hypothetical protein
MSHLSPYYQIQQFKIGDVDVGEEFIKSISIYCDVNSIGVTIKTLINDVYSMKDKLPVKGGEVIKVILIDSFENEFKKEFILTHWETPTQEDPQNQTTMIKGISKVAFELLNNFGAVEAKGKISDIVSKLVKGIEVTQTQGEIDTFNPWSHAKFIYWLSKFAQNQKYGGGFLFYEDFEKFHFQALDEIISKQTSVNNFYQSLLNPNYKWDILEYEYDKNVDVFSLGTSNIFSQQYSVVNVAKKEVKRVNYKVDEADMKYLGKGKLFDNSFKLNNTTTHIPLELGQDFLINGYLKFQNVFKTYAKRLYIVVNGDFTYFPGMLINVTVEERYEASDFNVEDNGIYMIEKIADYLDGERHYMKLSLIRNASYNYKTTNKNIISPKINKS